MDICPNFTSAALGGAQRWLALRSLKNSAALPEIEVGTDDDTIVWRPRRSTAQQATATSNRDPVIKSQLLLRHLVGIGYVLKRNACEY
jgi:hypothetical protein